VFRALNFSDLEAGTFLENKRQTLSVERIGCHFARKKSLANQRFTKPEVMKLI
jgi:hypothetical protein